MKHRLSAFALAALLAAVSLWSCADTPASDGGESDTTPTTDGTQTAESSIYDVLPEQDYGGYQFRVLNNTSNFAYTNFGMEEQTGEALDDAIFYRNARVEDTLNIDLVVTDMAWEDNQRAINKTVPAGEDAYDIYFNELHFVLGQALNGYLMDYTEIEVPSELVFPSITSAAFERVPPRIAPVAPCGVLPLYGTY